jgi:hypothetical protein
MTVSRRDFKRVGQASWPVLLTYPLASRTLKPRRHKSTGLRAGVVGQAISPANPTISRVLTVAVQTTSPSGDRDAFWLEAVATDEALEPRPGGNHETY